MTRHEQEKINLTAEFIRERLTGAEGGHDWWHIYRVWNLSKIIARNEAANDFVVELGALMHDIADAKFYDGDESVGPNIARNFLSSIRMDNEIIQQVENIINHISFKGGNERQNYSSIELDIVQDADRLDALGAIGIARTFNYGGYKNRPIHVPGVKPNLNMSKEEYRKNESPTLNHFYEKLLLLKDRMNTASGKQLAEQRQNFMKQFLEQFYREWNLET